MNLFSRDPKRDELKAIPLFAELPSRAFELVARNSDLVEIPAGTTVIREGKRGHEFFAIARGEVEISQAASRSRPSTPGTSSARSRSCTTSRGRRP